MKISLDEAILQRYIDTSYEGEVADAIWNGIYFALEEEDITSIQREIENGMKPSAAYFQKIFSEADDEAKSHLSSVAFGYGLEGLQELDPKPYLENPYAQLLLGKGPCKKGNITFKKDRIKAFHPFLYNDKIVDANADYADVSPVGYFKEDFSFPALYKEKRIWMSLVPHELNTMEGEIAKAKGNVATLGLGLGYFAFMVSNKENVTSVTIYEKDPDVIALFQIELLPFFPHKEKIKIIKKDALSYVNDPLYDYVYCDLWHDAEDGLPLYLRLKSKERSKEPTAYWIEQDILVTLRRYLCALLEEEANGSSEEDYLHPVSQNDRIFASLHALLKDVEVKDEEDLRVLLSSAFLKNLAKHMEI